MASSPPNPNSPTPAPFPLFVAMRSRVASSRIARSSSGQGTSLAMLMQVRTPTSRGTRTLSNSILTLCPSRCNPGREVQAPRSTCRPSQSSHEEIGWTVCIERHNSSPWRDLTAKHHVQQLPNVVQCYRGPRSPETLLPSQVY